MPGNCGRTSDEAVADYRFRNKETRALYEANLKRLQRIRNASNASETHVTPRGEEIRGEEIRREEYSPYPLFTRLGRIQGKVPEAPF
jgi:hypothetical protein